MPKTTNAPTRNGSGTPKTDERIIDVDAHRQARLEALGPPPKVRLGGRDFELPPELPADVVGALGSLQNNDFTGLDRALDALFGEHVAAIKALTPAWADQEFLLMATVEAYGFSLPE
jgi:hypothetical protein